MRTIPVRAAQPEVTSLLEAATAEFGSCYTLADLLSWCARQSPRTQVTEIITQDEYTHAVMAPLVR